MVRLIVPPVIQLLSSSFFHHQTITQNSSFFKREPHTTVSAVKCVHALKKVGGFP